MNKKKFTATIRTEKKLNIKGFHQLDRLKEKDGSIITKINQESAVQALSHKLYRNAESGFREILNNEVRACQIAKDKYGSKNAYIKVSLDTTDRSLIVRGINSQGITIEVLDVLREIGQSITESKKGGRIPFGMGFYGSLKLSSIVQVQTRCIENKDCYGVQLKGGLFFEEIQPPIFKETGTAIKVTLKPKTNYEKIVETLVEVSKTSGVKTYFELKAHNGNIAGFSSGIHELESTTVRKLFDETIQGRNSYLTASINNNEVEAYISIAINSSGNLQNDRSKELFLVNSPIDAILDEQDYDDYDYEANNDDDDKDDDYNYDNDDDDDEKVRVKYQATKIDEINFYSVVVNMKKESIFPAMQDRERLDPRAEKKLREVIVQLYNEALNTIKPCHELKEWFNHDHKYFISSNKKMLIDLDKSLDQKTIKLQTLLNTEVFSYRALDERTELRELKYLLEDISTDLINSKNILLFYALKKDKRVWKILSDNYTENQPYFLCLIDPSKYRKEKNIDPNITSKKYAELVKTTETKIKTTKNILEFYGFVNAKEYIKENGLKRTIIEKEEEEEEEKIDKTKLVTLHRYNYPKTKDTISTEFEPFERNKEDMIKVKDFSKYQKLISQVEDHDCILVKDDPKIEKLSDVTTTNDVYQEIKKKKFLTNFGNLTVEEILQTFTKSTDITLNPTVENENFKLINRVPKVSSRDKRVSQLYIIGNNTKGELADFEDSKRSRRRGRDNRTRGGKIIPNARRRSRRTVQVDDYSDYFKLAIVLIDNNRKYEFNTAEDDLEEYYKSSLYDLETNLEELIGDTKNYRDEKIGDETFDSVEQFEEYLNSLKEINEKVRNQTLRKLFALGHSDDNYKDMIKEVLKLNNLITPNRINRKKVKEYL